MSDRGFMGRVGDRADSVTRGVVRAVTDFFNQDAQEAEESPRSVPEVAGPSAPIVDDPAPTPGPEPTAPAPEVRRVGAGDGDAPAGPMPVIAPAQPRSPVMPDLLNRIDEVRGEVTAVTSVLEEIAKQRELELRMYEEIRVHRAGDDVTRSLPLYRGLIHVLDRISELKRGDHTAIEVLDAVEDELFEVLDRQGVGRIATAPNSFDPATQRAIGHLEADAVESVRVVSAGYEYQGKVIRHASVLVRGTGTSASGGGSAMPVSEGGDGNDS